MNLDLELPGALKAYALARRGFGRFSIGYNATKKRQGVGNVQRYLEEIELHEVSCVVFPAAPRAIATGVKDDAAEYAATVKALEALVAHLKADTARAKAEVNAQQLARLDRLWQQSYRAEKRPTSRRTPRTAGCSARWSTGSRRPSRRTSRP